MYEALKPLGILSVCIAWGSMIFLVYKWRGNASMSLSQHAAHHRAAFLMAAILESIFLPLWLVFIATWFAHTYQFPLIYIVLNIFSVIGLLIAAWVPDVVGVRGRIHHAVANPAYLCAMASILFIIFSSNVRILARLISLGALLNMLVCAYLLKHPIGRKHFLYFQGSYLASIHIAILSTTYIR